MKIACLHRISSVGPIVCSYVHVRSSIIHSFVRVVRSFVSFVHPSLVRVIRSRPNERPPLHPPPEKSGVTYVQAIIAPGRQIHICYLTTYVKRDPHLVDLISTFIHASISAWFVFWSTYSSSRISAPHNEVLIVHCLTGRRILITICNFLPRSINAL
jgi:hypothetical protein